VATIVSGFNPGFKRVRHRRHRYGFDALWPAIKSCNQGITDPAIKYSPNKKRKEMERCPAVKDSTLNEKKTKKERPWKTAVPIVSNFTINYTTAILRSVS
jgi:hypothetical protein